MRFVLRMALRETRASWQRLLFFFLCLALGVGAIVALRSVIQSVRAVVTGEARTLIAADLLLSTGQGWTEPAQRAFTRRLTPAAGVRQRSEAIETATMVRPADGGKAVARMVELRGVDSAFPLYGRVRLRGGQPFSHALLSNRGAIVRPELLAQLDLHVGDSLLIGGQTFTIRGVLEGEPGSRSSGFSLGPRVLIDRQTLVDTGLLGFGSRARHQLMLRVDPARLESLTRELRDAMRNEFVNVRSWRNTESDVGEDLERAENYLSLVGLVVLVLGGIGVSSVTRVFIEQKLKSIAVLKCVGARTSQVLGVYLVQIMALGLAGSVLGVGFARLALLIVARYVGGTGPTGEPISYQLTASAVGQGVLVGLLVALLFSLVPLLRVRRIRPSLLLRQEAGSGGRDWLRIGAGILVAIALVAVAGWQAGSPRVGLIVCVGFVAVALVLWLAGWVLIKATRPLQSARSFAVRHAALRLDRPGNQTRVVLLAVGLGCFFIVGVRAVQVNLLGQFSFDLSSDSPDMFLIDIQQDQSPGVIAMVTPRVPQGAGPPRLLPVLRARVTGVRGREVRLDDVEDVRGRGSLAREYTVTYRPRPEANERIVAGRFWDATPSPRAEVSIEQSIRDRFKIQVGDTMRFDVLGQPIEARVTSVRAVNWRDVRAGGFMFVFRPGVLEAAPHGFIAPMRGPDGPEARARLQRDLVTAFPNVSVIDLREVLDTARSVIRTITLGVSVVGGLVIATGLMILSGAVAMTRFRRSYEAAILKTLGASPRTIGTLLLVEYSLLGALAGAVGTLGGVALSWAVSRWAIELAWLAPWRDAAAAVAITTVLVAAVGLVSSLDVLRRRPLATLRAE
jgi:putative ABC transport system permease protein